MKISTKSREHGTLGNKFEAVSTSLRAKRKTKVSKPFSIRFTDEERARLNREAGKRPLAAYIRHMLFGPSAPSQKTRRPSRKKHKPTINQQAIGKVLGALGGSRLASNLNQIAKVANMGALPVTPELVEELQKSCTDIRVMRNELIAALGIKPEDSP